MAFLEGFRTFTQEGTDKERIGKGQRHDKKRHFRLLSIQLDRGMPEVHPPEPIPEDAKVARTPPCSCV